MTLLLRRVSVGIELPVHLSHAYIYQNTLYIGCLFRLGSAYLHILTYRIKNSIYGKSLFSSFQTENVRMRIQF